ncbi:DUF2953 domain-containing protein [Methanofollis aquaemaris]|uniref:DUF2953 domain-containing protein n=1 Tax=Methanofollis aquaemaris TaxID=126734 RepID=A0A8A3S617_9EURY|nr:DUF2953 domain-containing protein [Methanofollis aquaemaris]QSZ67363.1 DUF2953 domain-containing protein [Methanofollis aquaemaris]
MGGSEIILLCTLLGFVGLFMFLILLIPLRIRGGGSFEGGDWAIALTANWAAAGIRVEGGEKWKMTFLLSRTPVMRVCLPSDEKILETEEAEAEEEVTLPGLKAVREAGSTLPYLFQYFRQIIAHTGLEKVSLWFRGGFGDPVTTGEVFGAVQALNGVLWPTPIHLKMEPLFAEGEPAGEGEIAFNIRRPVALLVSGARLIIQPEVRTTIQRATRRDE